MEELGNLSEIWLLIQNKADLHILFLPHAISQMNRPDRMIEKPEVVNVIRNGQIIENYPTDERGHSVLMAGYGNNGRPIHVHCAPKDEHLTIVTAYIPFTTIWDSEFKIRRKK